MPVQDRASLRAQHLFRPTTNEDDTSEADAVYEAALEAASNIFEVTQPPLRSPHNIHLSKQRR